jgi:hypothetical protein
MLDGATFPALLARLLSSGCLSRRYLSSNSLLGKLSFVFAHVVDFLTQDLNYTTTLAGGLGRVRPLRAGTGPTAAASVGAAVMLGGAFGGAQQRGRRGWPGGW